MAYEIPTYTLPIEGGDRSANSHLDWLQEIVAAFQLNWWLHNRVWDENTTGRLSYAPQGSDSLLVEATASPSMQVKVLLGAGFLSGVPFRKTSDTTIAALTAPTTNPRIDTIGIDPTDGSVVVYTGIENASPSAPAVATGIYKAAEVYLRVGSSAIYDAMQSTGGYIQNITTLFDLPGDSAHTSGLTVSGGAFVYDGTSGDITLPSDGLSLETDYAGEFNFDATDASGYFVFRTGGSTDKLTLGTPSGSIILHGSSHDLSLSADGVTLDSSGASQFVISQTSGTGIALKTGGSIRYDVDETGAHTWYGSSGNINMGAAGLTLNFDYAGAVAISATDAAGTLELYSGTELINAYARLISIADEGNVNHAGVECQSYGTLSSVLRRGSFNAQCARGTVASPTAVVNADVLWRALAKGYDGSTYQDLADIRMAVDGNPSSGDMPGRIQFYTTPDGGSTLAYCGGFRQTKAFEVMAQAHHVAQQALSTTGAVTWDLREYPKAKMDALSGDVTLTVSNIGTNYEGMLYVKQHASSAKAITWPATVKWAGGVAPDISTAGSEHLFAFYSYDGTNLVGAHIGDFA